MEEIIFYLLFFVIGTVFGSFFTLAVYRIPLHQDITHKRSYCPNCNHRLSFWDMIPIFSYICLGGKCRYCKEKIRIRYLFLEILTGIVFLLFVMSLNINFYQININEIIYLIFGLLFIAGLIIIAGIDKEKYEIQKSVILYLTIITFVYMIYLYTVGMANIYRYVIYLCLIALSLILQNEYLRKKQKTYYPLEILELSVLMGMFTGSETFLITSILTLLLIAINSIIHKIKRNKHNNKENELKMPIGFYLCITNIISIIIVNFIAFRG